MPGPWILAARRWRFDEPRPAGCGRERNCACVGARRLQTACGKLAGRRADDANQSAGRTIPGGSETRHTHDGAWRVRFGIRRARRPQAGEHSCRRAIDFTASGQRTIRPRPRARGVRLPVRRKENAGAYRPHVENRQAATKLGGWDSSKALAPKKNSRAREQKKTSRGNGNRKVLVKDMHLALCVSLKDVRGTH